MENIQETQQPQPLKNDGALLSPEELKKREKQATIPWVEKYRPTDFDKIVIEPFNRRILQNILNMGYFPNLLLYGPPGTGKTTTIINLIHAFQTRYYTKNNDLIIHLNASDDRGIDIIRNQICTFVNSSGLFNTGLKFVILDEIDYMTKNAQHALRYLLTNNMQNVRFCLMCNYISKIDEGLQNNFLKLRFNQLPAVEIFSFLENIIIHENLSIDADTIRSIQMFYKSDIRSMINFIQTNQDFMIYSTPSSSSSSAIKPPKIKKKNMFMIQNSPTIQIINDNIWIEFIDKIRTTATTISLDNNINQFVEFIYSVSIQYSIDVKTIIKLLLHYIIRNNIHQNTGESDADAPQLNAFLISIENIMHADDIKVDIYLKYVLIKIIKFLT